MHARTRYHPILIVVAAVIASTVVVGVLTLRSPVPKARGDGEGGTTTAAPTAAPRADAPGGTRIRGCANCGVVESVRAVEVRGDIGADGHADRGIAESVVDGQTATRRISYRVTVRMDDGSYRTLSQVALPAVGVGAQVRVVDGVVVPRGANERKTF